MNPYIFSEDKQLYNNFIYHSDIEQFSRNRLNYDMTVKTCLQNKLEDLAIALVDYDENPQDKSVIEVAIETSSMAFLKFTWEKSNETYDEQNRNSVTFKHLTLKNILSAKKKSILYHQSLKLNSSYLNKREVVFTLSYLVAEFKRRGKFSYLNQIITDWKYLDGDEEFLKTLFDNNCFSQICTLIWKNKIFWTFNEENFKKVIEHEQVDLILHFLQLRECRNILNTVVIQKTIVNNCTK